MELDKRIKAITDIKSVTDGCHDWELMNKKGYFANRIVNFTDLSTCAYGEYAEYREHDQCFLCEGDKTYYSYFLPEDVLEPVEKKYRPYTLAEWIGQHTIGDVIRYRCKSQKIELRHLYVGYAYGIGTDIKHTTSGTLTLGVASYTLDYLLEDYEIEVNGEWLPFGVIDDDVSEIVRDVEKAIDKAGEL